MNTIANSSDIANLVKKRRTELGLTQIEASGLCGVGTRFWSELENGKETVQLAKVLIVLSKLGIILTSQSRT